MDPSGVFVSWQAWRMLSASLRKAVDKPDECGDLASGMAVLFAPAKKQEWRLGVVLTVCRSTAKAGCRPTALPIPSDAVRYFRVSELTPVPNTKEGTFLANASSTTSVCPIHRLGLVFEVEDTKAGIDGLQVVLGEKELQVI